VNERTSKFYLDYTFDAPDDPNRFYERSDHYNFAKVGIPIAFLFDNMNDDYHKPSDDSHKINYPKLLKVSDLVYGLMMEIANLDHKLKVDKQN
jgi:Zn-dependent M28 family amino/carboxypeptidase